MITNPWDYEQLCESERWAALQAATPEETIALGEALSTSELMDLAVFADDDAPMSLVIALGVASAQPPSTDASASK